MRLNEAANITVIIWKTSILGDKLESGRFGMGLFFLLGRVGLASSIRWLGQLTAVTSGQSRMVRSNAVHGSSNESHERRHLHDWQIVCQFINDWMAVFNSLEINGITYFEMNEMADARRLKCLYFDYSGDIKTLMERAADPKLFHLGV
jgi:hypothetical protein